LRLGDALKTSIIPELVGNTAMIRELHCYGRVKRVGEKDVAGGAQHFGIGKKLLEMAEEIAMRAGYIQMAVISGIGVRDYYRKRGYELVGTYMMKGLDRHTAYISICILSIIAFIAIIAVYINYVKNM
jgi:elongator complex protein 3